MKTAKIKVVTEIVNYIKIKLKGKTENGTLVITYRQVQSWYMNKTTTDDERCYIFYDLFDVDKILELTRIIKNELGIRYVQQDELQFSSKIGSFQRMRKYGEAGKGGATWIKRLRDAVSCTKVNIIEYFFFFLKVCCYK